MSKAPLNWRWTSTVLPTEWSWVVCSCPKYPPSSSWRLEGHLLSSTPQEPPSIVMTFQRKKKTLASSLSTHGCTPIGPFRYIQLPRTDVRPVCLNECFSRSRLFHNSQGSGRFLKSDLGSTEWGEEGTKHLGLSNILYNQFFDSFLDKTILQNITSATNTNILRVIFLELPQPPRQAVMHRNMSLKQSLCSIAAQESREQS